MEITPKTQSSCLLTVVLDKLLTSLGFSLTNERFNLQNERFRRQKSKDSSRSDGVLSAFSPIFFLKNVKSIEKINDLK